MTPGATDSTCGICLGFISCVSTRFSSWASIFKGHSSSLPYKKSPIADDPEVSHNKTTTEAAQACQGLSLGYKTKQKKGFCRALQKSLPTAAPGAQSSSRPLGVTLLLCAHPSPATSQAKGNLHPLAFSESSHSPVTPAEPEHVL